MTCKFCSLQSNSREAERPGHTSDEADIVMIRSTTCSNNGGTASCACWLLTTRTAYFSSWLPTAATITGGSFRWLNRLGDSCAAAAAGSCWL